GNDCIIGRSRAVAGRPRVRAGVPAVTANVTDKAATASEVAAAVLAGKNPPAAAVEAAPARIAPFDKASHTLPPVVADRARGRAAAIDAAVAAGKSVGPLAGVPFAVKNLFDIAGIPTLAGSKINADHAPAPRDATLIRRLEAAGAILLGGLNMGE